MRFRYFIHKYFIIPPLPKNHRFLEWLIIYFIPEMRAGLDSSMISKKRGKGSNLSQRAPSCLQHLSFLLALIPIMRRKVRKPMYWKALLPQSNQSFTLNSLTVQLLNWIKYSAHPIFLPNILNLTTLWILMWLKPSGYKKQSVEKDSKVRPNYFSVGTLKPPIENAFWMLNFFNGRKSPLFLCLHKAA